MKRVTNATVKCSSGRISCSTVSLVQGGLWSGCPWRRYHLWHFGSLRLQLYVSFGCLRVLSNSLQITRQKSRYNQRSYEYIATKTKKISSQVLEIFDETASELWPDVIAVGSVYGDPGNNYASFLLQHAGTTYPADAQFLWNQPFSAENLVSNSTSPASPPALAPVSVPTDTVGAPHSSGTTRSIPGHLTSLLTFWITLSSITLVYWDFIGIY